VVYILRDRLTRKTIHETARTADQFLFGVFGAAAGWQPAVLRWQPAVLRWQLAVLRAASPQRR